MAAVTARRTGSPNSSNVARDNSGRHRAAVAVAVGISAGTGSGAGSPVYRGTGGPCVSAARGNVAAEGYGHPAVNMIALAIGIIFRGVDGGI